MIDPVPFGSLEGRLAGHLAASLANHLVQMADSTRAVEGTTGPARKGDSFFHSFQTCFQLADEALEDIGVYLPETRADGHTLKVFAIDAADMPNFLATRRDDEKAAQLRAAFVRIACGYGGLPDGIGWFEAPPAWQVAMRHLALGGYAEQSASLFRWTAKIGTAMRSAGLWDKNDRSLVTLAAIEEETDAELAWRTMPDTLREAVLSSKIGFLELVKVVAVSWRDGRWHAFTRDSPIRLSNAMRLTEKILRRAKCS